VAIESKKPSKDDFAREFILTGCKNGTQAAISAGYSEKTAAAAASRLLKDVNVLTMIDEYKKASFKKYIWTKEEKLLKLEKIVEKAMLDDPEKGMINMQSAIAAIKEHNLMQGDNAPTETNSNLTVNDTLASLLTGGSKR
jgi:phage terminase small subunit